MRGCDLRKCNVVGSVDGLRKLHHLCVHHWRWVDDYLLDVSPAQVVFRERVQSGWTARLVLGKHRYKLGLQDR